MTITPAGGSKAVILGSFVIASVTRGRSEGDQAVSSRIATAADRGEGRTRPDRKATTQFWRCSDHVVVVAAVEHQEDDPVEAHVAGLGVDPTFQRLDIADPRLGLDQRTTPTALDDRVGAAAVASDRDRHFRHPSDRRPESPTEACEQGKVRAVTDWRSDRVDGHAEFVPDGCSDARKDVDVDRWRLAPLDPPQVGVRDAGGSGNDAKAQAAAHSGDLQLRSEPDQQGTSALRPSSPRGSTVRHFAQRVTRTARSGLVAELAVTAQKTTERRHTIDRDLGCRVAPPR